MGDSWYKAGDKVVIRKDLADYDLIPFGKTLEMERYAGKTATINGLEKSPILSDIQYEGKSGDGYRYYIEGYSGSWNVFMFDNDKSKALNTSGIITDNKTINIKVTKPVIKLNFKL